MRPRILIVEDEPILRKHITRLLVRVGFEVVEASTRREATLQLERDRFDALILDVKLPDGNGLDLLEDLPNGAVRPRAVVMTADLSPEHALRAVALDVAKVFHKPLDLLELAGSVGALCDFVPLSPSKPSGWGISPTAWV